MANTRRNDNRQIVTFGGGSGSPVVHEALLLAGIEYITAISAVYDNGGATGQRRYNDRGELAWSDPMREMLSLVPPELRETPRMKALYMIFHHRNERNIVLGQEIFSHFWSAREGFIPIENLLKDLGVPLKGKVLPASIEPAHIAFTTSTGRTYQGEHHLDDLRMSRDKVVEMHLEPACVAYQPAVASVEAASYIILCPGSIHASVLCNFLPAGMKEAIAESQSKVIYVANLLSTGNEAENPYEFLSLIEQYTGRKPDIVVIPNITRSRFEYCYPDTARIYGLDGQYWIDWNEEVLSMLADSDITAILHDAVSIIPVENHSIVRHNPAMLAESLAIAVEI